MDQAELRLGYEPNPSGYGSISASVMSMGFSGATMFAVTPEQLRPFLDALGEYPLRHPVKLSIGEFDGKTLIAITVSPSNSRGGLKVDVELRNDCDRNRFVSTSLSTVYPDIEAFRLAFANVIRLGGVAILSGAAGRS